MNDVTSGIGSRSSSGLVETIARVVVQATPTITRIHSQRRRFGIRTGAVRAAGTLTGLAFTSVVATSSNARRLAATVNGLSISGSTMTLATALFTTRAWRVRCAVNCSA